jgi:chromosome segregation ATPase
VSKLNSRDKIGKSIDGILSGLTIRGRSEDGGDEVDQLKKQLAIYEEKLGSLETLQKENDILLKAVSRLKQEQDEYIRNVEFDQSKLRQMENENGKLKGEHTALEHSVKEKEIEKNLLIKEIEVLSQRKEEVAQELNGLEQQQENENVASINFLQSKSPIHPELTMYEKDKKSYQPSQIIRQYCDQSEGKRKLTIHLREIEYQAILKASQNMSAHKGKLMDTITRALRFYISNDYYQEAEQEVYQKAIYSVRGFLEKMGFSPEDIEKKIR